MAQSRGSGRLATLSIELLSAIGIILAVIYIFNIQIGGLVLLDTGYLYLLISLFLPWAFITKPFRKTSPVDHVPWYDWLLAVISFGIPLYYFFHAVEILIMGWEMQHPVVASIAGVVLWALIIEAARRCAGSALAVIALVVSLYPLLAGYMPGVLKAPNISLQSLVGMQIMGIDGLLGIPLRVTATEIIGFLLFGVVLNVIGGGRFFTNIALTLLGGTRGGPAKVAIIASALFGSISGSPTANILTVGTFTIPTMKRVGYPAPYAAAVETCASTGGALMPPVMGAAAFVMAAFLRVSYTSVAIAAVIPSLLYFFSLFVQLDSYAGREGLKGLPASERPPLGKLLMQGWPYLVGLVFLIYMLFWVRSVREGPFYTTALLLVLAMIRRETRLNFNSVREIARGTANMIGTMLPAMCGIGFIIGGLAVTGTAHAFSTAFVQLAGGNLVLMVIMGAIASYLLGMGLSATPCYVFLALVLAPGLILAGFDTMATHLFILYCGILSFITPPVAAAVYVAAPLAGASPMKTGIQAVRLGIVLFIIPFFFIFNPALILHGDTLTILHTVITAFIGIWCLASALGGYMVWLGRLSIPMRVVIFSLGLLLAVPYWMAELAGIGMAVFVILYAFLSRRHARLAAQKARG